MDLLPVLVQLLGDPQTMSGLIIARTRRRTHRITEYAREADGTSAMRTTILQEETREILYRMFIREDDKTAWMIAGRYRQMRRSAYVLSRKTVRQNFSSSLQEAKSISLRSQAVMHLPETMQQQPLTED